MYSFTDTTKKTPDTVAQALPTEAVSFNGSWLDRSVPGFRTLSVSGRESIQAEITQREKETSHGSRYIRRRYPKRIIIVNYKLEASSSADFRAAYNTLNELLNAEDAKIIFNDEVDKYFMGTCQTVSEVEAGKNIVAGSIEFLCNDPFKYDDKYTTVSVTNAATAKIITKTAVRTPMIIEIIPTFNMTSLTLKGVAVSSVTGKDSPIVIKNLSNGKKVIIDGENGLVTESGSNKFGDSSFWEFPTLKKGDNNITITAPSGNPQCTINFKYRACYI